MTEWRRRHLGTSGSGDTLHAVTALVLNMDRITFARDVELAVDGWQVTVEEAGESQIDDLSSLGGHGGTHIVRICRMDSQPFSEHDMEDVLSSLYHFLGFLNGRLAGLALLLGWDDSNEICWCEWSIRKTDPWRSSLTWYDRSLSDRLPSLFASWFETSKDPFWRQVLQRVSRLIAAANHPDPLDDAVVTAATGLEFLAWAILRIDRGWVGDDSGEIKAAGMNRLLLCWAGIPLAVPTELKHLAKVAKSRSLDGPAAIAWTRNRLVHPPRRARDSWPSGDVLRDAWRLALEYLELCTLRLLSYDGSYAHRRHMNGRWVGETTPVPWASGDKS